MSEEAELSFHIKLTAARVHLKSSSLGIKL